jgi:hypothetical protein
MPQQSIRLPLETTLRLKIAMLEHDLARLQGQLLQQEAEYRHQTTVAALLLAAQVTLPVALTACTFDADKGVLCYECPEVLVPAEAARAGGSG